MLTPRWTPILEKGLYGLRGQRLAYWNNRSRFTVCPAGRRSLKTELAKRRLIDEFLFNVLRNNKGYTDEKYAYTGPTVKQAERIAWDDLKKLCPKEYVKRIWEGDLIIESIYGPELWVTGLDRPERIEGAPLDGIVCDEFPDIPQGAWEANIRPALSDRKAWAILIGVPDFEKPNNQKFKELYELGLNGKNPEYKSFTWLSKDVLPDSEIDSAMEDLSPILFRQEYEASFESAPGRAYGEFTKNFHVKEIEYLDRKPVYLSCDFNYGYHNWLLLQMSSTNDIRVLDQIFLRDASVEAMCALTTDKLKVLADESKYPDGSLLYSNGKDVVLYGDYSGEQKRAEATYTAWRQIKQTFPKAEPKYRVQPPIADRISVVNSYLRNAKGESRLTISPKCINLITDLEQVTRTMLFSQNKSDSLTHASDALGYFLIQMQRTEQINKALRK